MVFKDEEPDYGPHHTSLAVHQAWVEPFFCYLQPGEHKNVLVDQKRIIHILTAKND